MRSVSGGQMSEPTIKEGAGKFNQIGIDELLYLRILVSWMMAGPVAGVQCKDIAGEDNRSNPQ
jgi:hypothetical protein